ncbi:hypothetical protein AGMMS49992_01060 [Clostridia bacterium]|nr:hypothetical protein AGMMS49992_01060 [Clostridia bacterium]
MKRLIPILLTLALVMCGVSFAQASANPVNLIWWMGTDTTAPTDQAMVEAELNKLSAEALGITIQCTYMTNDQIRLAMSAGEYFDIAFTTNGWYNDFNMNVYDGMFKNIDGLVQELTPDLWASMPDMLWQGSYVNVDGQEGLYAVPVMKDYGIEVFWIIDIDYFVTEKGFEILPNMTFDAIEPFLAQYKADFPNDYPIKEPRGGITSWSNFMDWINEDSMISLSYNDIGTENEGTVYLAFEMPEFIERVSTIRRWYEAGFINPDAAVTQSLGRASRGVIQSGQGFYGADSIWSNARQKASAISRYDGPFLSTYSLQGSLLAISAASNHVEESLKILEYANLNRTYRNMMRYGLQDVHYTANEDGTVTKLKQGSENYSPWAYTQASYSNSAVEASPFPSVPADPNMWQVVWAGYSEAVTSTALGFAFDYTPVQAQVNAAMAIKEMYWAEMQTGTSDPAVVFPQIIKELEDAGIRDVIAEAQSQLNAFLGK